jgi:hypothetical protein
MLDNKEINYIGLNGISQRPPAVRPEGQVDDMYGFLPTPADGLQTAPTAEFVGYLDMTLVPNGKLTADMEYIAINDALGNYYLVLVTGNATTPILAWDELGANIDISSITQDVLDYFKVASPAVPAKNFVTRAYKDNLVVSNKTITVGTLGPEDLTGKTLSVNIAKVLVAKISGEPSKTYNITIDGTVFDQTYGVSTNRSITEIVTDFHTAINANPDFVATIDATDQLSVVRVDAQSFNMFSSSPSYVEVIQSEVSTFSNLPQNVPDGTILKVQPDVDQGKATPYWVEYNNGVWVERADPYASQGFGSATTQELPVLMRVAPLEGDPTYSAQLQITKPQYTLRNAGDEESNPDPSFVGDSIIDIVAFQGRLGFVSRDGIDWSCINKPNCFYRETAVDVYDDDPILMTFSGSRLSTRVYEAEQFHDVVYVSTDTGKYIIEGGSAGFTPNNYKVSMISSLGGDFISYATTIEDKLFFAIKNDNYIQFREYVYGDDYIDVEPKDITIDVPRLVDLKFDVLVPVNEMRMLVAGNRSATEEGDCFAFAYRYDVEEKRDANDTGKIQSAWFKLRFPLHVGLGVSDRGIWTFGENGEAFLSDLRRQQDHALCMWSACDYNETEGKWRVVTDALTYYGSRLNDDIEIYARRTDGTHVYKPEFTVDLATGFITFADDYGELEYVVVGQIVEVAVTLPEPFVRKESGFGVSSGTMRLRSMDIYSRNAGKTDVTVAIADRDPLRPTVYRTHSFGEDYELDVQQLDGPKSLERKDSMPINSRSQGMTSKISSQSARPLDIISVGYNYRYVTNKRIR